MIDKFITAVLALAALWVLVWFIEQIFGEIPKPLKIAAAIILFVVLGGYFLKAFGWRF